MSFDFMGLNRFSRSVSAVLILVGLSVCPAYAVGMKDAYEALRNVEDDFVNTGTICEHVAQLEMQERFPKPQYETWIGVSYKIGQEVIGELDLVVRDRAARKVVLIGEVKCWRDLRAGLEKANEQEARFRETLGERREPGESVEFLKFLPGGKSIEFETSEFNSQVDYIAIAQNGARSFGYDQELELSLEDLMQLRKQILSKRKP